MASSLCSICSTLLAILLIHKSAIAQTGYNEKEKEALYALKATFNNAFLNDNWSETPCFFSEPSKWYGIQCDRNGRVTGIVLENLRLTGNLKSEAFSDLTEISVLSLKNNSIKATMMDFSSNQKLTRIDISQNMLFGPMSSSLLRLGILESLSVQHNGLGGSIPDLNQSTLNALNLSYNSLYGPIPTTQALQKFDYSSYIGNKGLCGSPSLVPCDAVSPPQLDSDNKNGSSSTTKKDPFFTPYSVAFYCLLLVFIAIAIFLSALQYMKSRKLKKLIKEVKASSTKQMNEESKIGGKKAEEEGEAVSSVGGVQEKGKLIFTGVEEGAVAEFELGDLLKASAEGLGRGIFGNSYKAKMIGKEAVVVKRIRDLKPLITEEFNKQLQLIANLKHPNLLPLLAYYHTKDEKLLLYRYVQNGNLFNRLFDMPTILIFLMTDAEARGPNRIPFTWTSRLSVAHGVAQAVEYLHLNATSPNIPPHGNLKSSNILLNENDTVLVSDYGFASLVALPIAAQRMVAYKAPEYKRNKRVSVESDVWSYGSLLLELLTGKISICTAPPDVSGLDLCSWVHRAVREEWTAEIFDQELSDEHRTTSSGMLRLLQIAMQCCDPSPEKRPMMSEVAREVQNIRNTESTGVDSDDSVG